MGEGAYGLVRTLTYSVTSFVIAVVGVALRKALEPRQKLAVSGCSSELLPELMRTYDNGVFLVIDSARRLLLQGDCLRVGEGRCLRLCSGKRR